MKMPERCTGPKLLSKSLGKWSRRHLGGHDLVRRMDRQREVLIRCRKCSGYARQRMGPKLVNCCKLEQMGIEEFGKMMKIFKLSRKEEFQPKRLRIGELRKNRKELQERSARGC